MRCGDPCGRPRKICVMIRSTVILSVRTRSACARHPRREAIAADMPPACQQCPRPAIRGTRSVCARHAGGMSALQWWMLSTIPRRHAARSDCACVSPGHTARSNDLPLEPSAVMLSAAKHDKASYFRKTSLSSKSRSCGQSSTHHLQSHVVLPSLPTDATKDTTAGWRGYAKCSGTGRCGCGDGPLWVPGRLG